MGSIILSTFIAEIHSHTVHVASNIAPCGPRACVRSHIFLGVGDLIYQEVTEADLNGQYHLSYT